MNHEEIIEKFNEFIKKWCGDNAPHLLDSDENDGEEFREALSLKEQEIEILQKSKRDMHIEDYKKHKKIISSLQEKIELIVEEQVNICKERLKRMPDDEFYLGKIQGLRTAEDRLLTIFKEMGE